MAVKERGSIRHLESTVLGHLSPKANAWTALNVLFPSITAAGIPKNVALEAIERLETRSRELYSGAILLMDGKEDLFEATLCLRTISKTPTARGFKLGLASSPDPTLSAN
jgi:salicylate synthetase